MFNLKTIKNLKHLFKTNKTTKNKGPVKFNLPKYLIMFLFVPAISCGQSPTSKIGLPIPPYDSYASLFSAPLLYFIYIMILVILLLFSIQPIAKLYKMQTCSLIGVTNCFLILHILAIFSFNMLRWLILIIGILGGTAMGVLSLSSDEMRGLAILPPIGYVIGYWVVAILGFQNPIVALVIVGLSIFGSFFLKLLIEHEKIIFFGRGLCVGFLALVTADIVVFPLGIIQIIHKAGFGYIPFLPFLVTLGWGCLLLIGIYYEFNRTKVNSEIENRNLSPADRAKGIGVKPDDKEYREKIEPSASLV